MSEAFMAMATEFVALMNSGATAGECAEWMTRQMGKPGYVALSHMIEGAALPGTFAEAVFDMLCA
jgi:hypothetical protein